MDPDGAIPDDLKVRLDWPQGPRAATDEPGGPSTPPTAEAAVEGQGGVEGQGAVEGQGGVEDQAAVEDRGGVEDQGGAVPPPAQDRLPELVARTDRAGDLALVEQGVNVQAALAGVAARLDALTGAATSLRGLLADRLTDLATQADRSREALAHQGENDRRIQQRALADIEGAVGETEQSLHRLDQTVARIAVRLDEVAASLTGELQRATARAVDALAGEVASGAEVGATAAASVTAAVEGLRDRLDREIEAAERDRAQMEGMRGLLDQVIERLEVSRDAGEDSHRATREAVAEVRDLLADVAARPAPEPPDLAPVTALVEGLTAEVQGLSGLVDAVAERPEVDLGPLAAQLDRLGASAAELLARPLPPPPDLDPVLAGLTGVAEAVAVVRDRPDPEPIDLGPVLQALEELVTRPLPPDLGPLAERIEGLAARPGLELLRPIHEALDDLQGRRPTDLAPVLAQLAELRQVAEALPATLATSVAPAEHALAALEDRLIGLGEAVRAGPESVAQLREAVANVAEPVRADLQSLLEGVSELGASLLALREVSSSDATVRDGFDSVLAAIAAQPPVEVPPEVREVKRALEGLELAVTERDRSEASLFESLITRLERRIDEVGRSVRTTVETAASSPDEVTRATMARIERAVAQQPPVDASTVKALGEIDQTLGRLAQAQAEDLERVLEAVEGQPETKDLTPVAAQLERNAARLEQAIESLRTAPVAPPPSAPAAGDGEVLERLQALGVQLDGLRRRIALRGRSTPALDDAAIEALSEAVAGRVAALLASPTNGAAPHREK